MLNIINSQVHSVAFSKRLAAIRKSKGLTQEGLADVADLTKLQIHRYEKGSSQPTLQTLKRLALGLNTSIDQLVFEDDERGPEDELLMLFEGVSRLDDSEQKLIKELIESVMLKHDAKRYFKQSLAT